MKQNHTHHGVEISVGSVAYELENNHVQLIQA